MKAGTRQRRKFRNILVIGGCIMVLGGALLYIISPSASIPPTRYSFKVEDSSTKAPLSGAMIFVLGLFSRGGGVIPLGTIVTDSGGSASILTSTKVVSMEISKRGYQTYIARNIPNGTSYLVLLGNGTSSVALIGQSSGIPIVFPTLSLAQWLALIVVVGGALLLLVAALREIRKKGWMGT